MAPQLMADDASLTPEAARALLHIFPVCWPKHGPLGEIPS